MKVGVIMPVKYLDMLESAISRFVDQTYQDKVLCIVLDSEVRNHYPHEILDPSKYKGQEVRVIILDGNEPETIGYKRNKAAAELSDCPILSHMDTDDWYHPDWLKLSIEFLQKASEQMKYITGLNTCLFFQAPMDLYKYHHDYSGSNQYVIEASMTYYHSMWREHNFPNKMVGEGETFCASHYGKVLPHPYHDKMIAMLHTRNTSGNANLQSPSFTKLGTPDWGKILRDGT